MGRLALPTAINAGGFLDFLRMLGELEDQADPLEINFACLRSVSPAALVVLTATVRRWQAAGRDFIFTGLLECPILGYLQRMDLLISCGALLAENFKRHESKGRFVPVCEVGLQSDEMAVSVAECLAPVGDDLESPIFDLNETIQYMLTEIANNVRQHSRGIGFVSAQLRNSEGLVRLAIADNGIGILESFRTAGFDWAAESDHVTAIERALQPRVSSRGRPTNEGVGLSTTIKLAELYGGWFAVISGNGCVRGGPGKDPVFESLPPGTKYRGTLLTLALRAEHVGEFPATLSKAKIALGILPKGFCGGRFSP